MQLEKKYLLNNALLRSIVLIICIETSFENVSSFYFSQYLNCLKIDERIKFFPFLKVVLIDLFGVKSRSVSWEMVSTPQTQGELLLGRSHRLLFVSLFTLCGDCCLA